METKTTEVAPDVFRICTMISEFNLQFCQFLVRDEEPVLFHTGMRSLFPLVRDAVAKVVDPGDIRWISFSHFEADECGALNEWLEIAPRATPLCGLVGAMVSVNDFASRPARVLEPDESLETGKYRFQYRATPQVPHAWDAGLLFEEANGTLFCSDLFHQLGGFCNRLAFVRPEFDSGKSQLGSLFDLFEKGSTPKPHLDVDREADLVFECFVTQGRLEDEEARDPL